MSEMAPEAPAKPSGGGKKENVFTRKIGPLPMWAWVAIVGGGILAWSLFSSKKAASSAADTSAAGTDASQVPQFVNQTYTTVTPPMSPPAGQPPPSPPGTPPPNSTPPKISVPPMIRSPLPRSPGSPQPNQRTEKTRHREDLYKIAKGFGITEGDLLKANPDLKKYEGTGKKLPIGTEVKVP